MNYYIDFDGTLYNSEALKKKMLAILAKTCHKQDKNLSTGKIMLEIASLFCREKIYDIFKLCNYLAEKYKLNKKTLVCKIDEVLKNGQKFVYKDSANFLAKLKKRGEKIYLLTHSASRDTSFQKQKVEGSGLCKYFNKMYITNLPKYTLNIDYQNGIFIDDNPTDILGLYNTNPIKVIRIKRKSNKYSKLPIKQISIEEITKLSELK